MPAPTRSPKLDRGEEALDKIADLSLPQEASIAQVRFTTLSFLKPRHSNRAILTKPLDAVFSGEPAPEDRERFTHHRPVLAGERLPERGHDSLAAE